MAGQCIARMSHHTDKCNSSDGVQVFENEDGSKTGFCFACREYIPDPEDNGKSLKANEPVKINRKTDEQIKQEINFINCLSAMPLPDRKLRQDSLEHYGIKIGVSEYDGKTPTYAYFPYSNNGVLVGYKCKHLPTGRVWWVSTSREVDLFGWEQAKASGAKRLIIVEGEFDAPALRGILRVYTKEPYKDSIPAVVSIPNGAGSAARDLKRLLPRIKKYFKDISLAFDMDTAGQEAVKEVCKLIPDARVVNLPAKDANKCLTDGMAKAAHTAVTFNTEKPKNTRLVWGSEIHDKAKQKAEFGLSWPWKGMTDLTRGIRTGETLYIGAGEKMGKSEVLNAVAAHLIREHQLKVFLAKPEESNVKTYKLLSSKMTGKIFHDPKVEFDEDAYEKGGKLIKDKVCMLNLYQNIYWDTLKDDIYAAANEGVKAAFIDPITNLTNGMSTTETNDHLRAVAQDMAVIAKDLDIVIFIFCHLNKPPKGATPWDRGGKITTDFFAGSSAMARSCNYAIGLQGDKDPEKDLVERNQRELVLLADREFGESGSVKLYWDYKTGLFNEMG